MVGADQTIDVVIRWDHRITDAALIARALTRLEQVLNTEIAAELRGRPPGRAEAGPGGRDLTIFKASRSYSGARLGSVSAILRSNARPFVDTRPFLPRNRLLAGRFRPALRFATRGPSLQALRAGPVGAGIFPAHRRARFLKHSNLIKEDAMTKRSEAKYKIDRRMGQNIWGRPKSPVNRREYGPGQHGQRRKGKLSDFGVQLRAKQKLKGYYANISERQFHGIYVEAGRMKGDTGENLIGLLERRLDTVVYRAKFVATMFAARQFINHGHVKVNGRKRQHRAATRSRSAT